MDYNFDLHETQLNILEICPEWEGLMNVVEFRNVPDADPAGYSGKTIYYNGRRMRNYTQSAQAYLIAQQMMHIQLSHQLRGRGRDRNIWDAACNAVTGELLIGDGFEPPANIRRFRDAAGLSAEEMYDILTETAEEDEQEPEETEDAEDRSEVEDILSSLKKDDKDDQAGGMQEARIRDIEDIPDIRGTRCIPDEDGLESCSTCGDGGTHKDAFPQQRMADDGIRRRAQD